MYLYPRRWLIEYFSVPSALVLSLLACKSISNWRKLEALTMNPAVRDAWRKVVVTTEEWEPHSDQARPVRGGTEAGGFLVRSLMTGLIGYLKPLKPRGNNSRAAYEKIASDLAFEIRVNVPPVVLYRRPDAQPPEPREVHILCVGRSSPVG